MIKKTEEDTKQGFVFKIDKEDLEILKTLAKKEDRTVASTIRMIIKEYLKNINK